MGCSPHKLFGKLFPKRVCSLLLRRYSTRWKNSSLDGGSESAAILLKERKYRRTEFRLPISTLRILNAEQVSNLHFFPNGFPFEPASRSDLELSKP